MSFISLSPLPPFPWERGGRYEKNDGTSNSKETLHSNVLGFYELSLLFPYSFSHRISQKIDRKAKESDACTGSDHHQRV